MDLIGPVEVSKIDFPVLNVGGVLKAWKEHRNLKGRKHEDKKVNPRSF
jgi:hypothetical protein